MGGTGATRASPRVVPTARWSTLQLDDARRLGPVGGLALGISATVLPSVGAGRAGGVGLGRGEKVPPRMSDALDRVVWAPMNLAPQLLLAALWLTALWLAWRVEVRR